MRRITPFLTIALAGGAAVAIDAVQPLRQLDVRVRVVEVAAVVLDRLGDRGPDLGLDRRVATVLVHRAEQMVAELGIAPSAAGEADDRELGGQEAAHERVVERGRQLALGQVA